MLYLFELLKLPILIDILRDDLNNAPNAGSSSIPDQEREPVDGGNDTQSVDDLPMDRLVLGESEPHPIAPPPRIITGSDISAPPPPMASVASNVEVRSEAAGSEINYSQAAIPFFKTTNMIIKTFSESTTKRKSPFSADISSFHDFI